MIVKRVFGLPRQIHPWSAWPVSKANTGISSPAFKHPIVSIVSRANTTMYWALPMLPRAKIVLRGTWVVVVVVLLFVVVCCCLLLFVVSDLFFLCTLCYSLCLLSVCLLVPLSPRRQYGSQDRLVAQGDNNLRSCVPCGGGKYGTQPGFDDPTDCTNCPIGKYLIAGGSTAVEDCKQCPRGFYGYRAGEWQTCKSCPIGKFLSSVNSTDPNDCDDCPSTWLLLLCRLMRWLMRWLR